MSHLSLGLTFAAALALAACATQPKPSPTPTLAQLAGEWRLDAIDGQPLADTLRDKAPTLTIAADGKVSGYAGVNRYFGAIDTDALAAGRFDIPAVAITKMAGPPDRMKLEDDFTSRLDSADAAAIASDVLVLSQAGAPTLQLSR